MRSCLVFSLFFSSRQSNRFQLICCSLLIFCRSRLMMQLFMFSSFSAFPSLHFCGSPNTVYMALILLYKPVFFYYCFFLLHCLPEMCICIIYLFLTQWLRIRSFSSRFCLSLLFKCHMWQDWFQSFWIMTSWLVMPS